MIKRVHCRWLYAGLLLILIALIMQSGCDGSGYKAFTLEKGIGHFSFEYPAQYKVEKVEVRDDSLLYTDVVLSGPGPTLENGGMDYTFISVFVDSTIDYPRSAEYDLENTLASASEFLVDFQLLERSILSIVGITGQQIIYYCNMGVREYPEDPEPELLPTIVRNIYFEQGDLIWNLHISYNQSIAEDAQAVFEHLLETFQILD